MKEHLKTLSVIAILIFLFWVFYRLVIFGNWWVRSSRIIDENRMVDNEIIEDAERIEELEAVQKSFTAKLDICSTVADRLEELNKNGEPDDMGLVEILKDCVEEMKAVQSEAVSREEEADNTETLTPDGGLALETKEEIKAYIRETARRYGVDEEKALRIAECESNFQNVCNYEYGDIGGMGIFQFIPQSWDYVMDKMEIKNGDPYDIKLNIEAGVYLFATEGESHWGKSAGCWQKNISPKAICPPIICNPIEFLDPNTCSCVRELRETYKMGN